MATLSTRHANQQTVSIYDFSGGLNTTASMDGIAENQLSECVNMEIDSATNRLKTVSGTSDMLKTDFTIYAAMHDTINHKMLLVDSNKKVYVSDFKTTQEIGSLSGTLYPITASWEDGLLIATGGHLQYYNGKALTTIDASPATCYGVYVRAGRVLVTTGNEIHYSGVGDETNWKEDTSDDSSSKFVEAGYKDGGQFVGMASLSSDVIIFKNNRRVYRLSGEYPNWSIDEISRNVECSGRRSFAAMSDTVFALGKNELQALTTTQAYGDVKPANLGTFVTKEIQGLPENALVRYVPPLQQCWAIGNNGRVLMYDISHQSWFIRVFNSGVIDVISVGDTVYVIKPDRVSKLDDSTFYDAGRPMRWRFTGKRMVSHDEYLLKRVQVSVLPQSSDAYSGSLFIGAVALALPIPSQLLRVYRNHMPIHANKMKISQAARTRGVYASGEKVFGNSESLYENTRKIFSRRDIIKESQNVYRSKFLDVRGYGMMGGFVLNSISLDLAEV